MQPAFNYNSEKDWPIIVSDQNMSQAKQQSNRFSSNPEDAIYRIPPFFYLHVLDQTTNVTRVEVGPKTYIRQDNERVIFGPQKMVIVPPSHYCVVHHPVVRNADNSLAFDVSGQVKLRHADLEVRLEQEPFPLYPGEVIAEVVSPLTVVPTNVALRLKAIRNFEEDNDGTKTARIAGDEWLFEGPGTYIPRKEVEVVETINATVIRPNQALKLRAQTEMIDREGKDRVTGEEWIIKKVGAYLPGAYEEIIDVVDAYVLTEKDAVHIRAMKTFVDDLGKNRKNGEEWLITSSDTETYIPGVYEKVVGVVNVTTLTNRQYCVILNPHNEEGKPQLGKKKLVKGEETFFLMPGETLENGIQEVFILGENEGLILRANETFTDSSLTPSIIRKPGDRWMVKGPMEYIPSIELTVVTKHNAIPLDDNEGIYVRNVKTGKVRIVRGETYMLTQDEELWNKELPQTVVDLLTKSDEPLADRGSWRMKAATAPVGPPMTDRSKAVTFRVPHNAAVQVYDYNKKKARVAFGPDLIMLGPDEQFTQLSISGDKPKRPNVIRTLCLLLGPDFCTDIITVETADHARLSLQLSYNWYFNVEDKSEKVATRIFSVPDFIGDLCKAIASRIRGAVAGVNFDDFHKNSAKIIRTAVFGMDENKKIRSTFSFPQNNLFITSVDIQGVEPVDQRTRDSLQKSVQLAIEITTQSQEATARHEADRREQEAKGRLERQRIVDEVEAEKSRRELLELKINSMAIESCGQSKAEALSQAEAQRIRAEAAVEDARMKAEAQKIEAEAELDRLQKARESELQYLKAQNELEVTKSEELARIETEKFKNTVDALGTNTITAIATAGPEFQVKLLQSLGIQSTLITDGNNPINLFSTAEGLLGGMLTSRSKAAKLARIDDDSSIG